MHKVLTALFVLSVLLVSCKNDPCKNENCTNNSICIDGKCQCMPGMEGLNCDEYMADKFTGKYWVDESCNSMNWTHFCEISKDNSDLLRIFLHNFYDGQTLSCSTILTAALKGSVVEIVAQDFNCPQGAITIEGSGLRLDDGKIMIQYSVSTNGTLDNCYAEFNPY